MGAKRTRYRLKHPVEYAGETVDSIELRRGKAKDLRGIPADEKAILADHAITLLSRLSGQSTELIGELDLEDFMRLAEELEGFLGKSRPTGGT